MVQKNMLISALINAKIVPILAKNALEIRQHVQAAQGLFFWKLINVLVIVEMDILVYFYNLHHYINIFLLANGNNNKCELCTDNCDTCADSSNKCLSCTGSFYLKSN